MALFTTSIDFSEVINPLLFPGEKVELQANLQFDFLAITSARLMFVDTTSSSSKKEVISVPSSRITEFAVVQAGRDSFAQILIIQVGATRRTFTFMGSGPNGAVEFYKAIAQKLA